jgi:hypothetical protein
LSVNLARERPVPEELPGIVKDKSCVEFKLADPCGEGPVTIQMNLALSYNAQVVREAL